MVGHNEVICYCSRMTSHFHWIITRNFSSIHILDHRIAYNKNFFLYHWAICQLLCNQVTIIVASMYCCFIILFMRGGSQHIGFITCFSINSVSTPWLLEWLSVTSVFILPTKLSWLSWITRQDWWLSKLRVMF